MGTYFNLLAHMEYVESYIGLCYIIQKISTDIFKLIYFMISINLFRTKLNLIKYSFNIVVCDNWIAIFLEIGKG